MIKKINIQYIKIKYLKKGKFKLTNKNNTKVSEYKEIKTFEDAEGNITTSTVERTNKVKKSEEPDYIKLYTDTWCAFNEIPLRLRDLFLELAIRMSYADSASPEESQVVYTGKPVSTAIMKSLNLKMSTYNQYLRELAACKAIRRVSRGVYQINPNYAGRGLWKYNPTLGSGGIEDLKATFDFVKGTVKTEIVWADDKKSNTPLDKAYREGGLKDATLKTTTITPKKPLVEEEIKGQVSVEDYNKSLTAPVPF